jgi:hypothetical protein
VATFQETPSKAGKVWVKAGTYDAGRRRKYKTDYSLKCFSLLRVSQHADG